RRMQRSWSSAVRSRSAICSLVLTLVAAPAFAVESAVDCDHLMAWLTGGASNASLIKILHSRGSGIQFSTVTETELRKAGASSELLIAIQGSSKVSVGHSSCSASLASAADLAHRKQNEDAEDVWARLIADNPNNGALHFALGYIRQQQGDWDGAFDEYSASKQAEAWFPPVHNRLALAFYQGDDGENAIGEARTA